MTGCTEGLDLTQRSVTFEGRMRPIAGTVTMQLRFVLQAQTPGDPRWRHVTAPGFDRWLSLRARRAALHVRQDGQSLLAPASYRATVRFRWLDADGHVLDQDEASRRVCRQDDLRPDLVPRRDLRAAGAGDTGQRRYGVLVRNAGRDGERRVRRPPRRAGRPSATRRPRRRSAAASRGSSR